MTTRTVGLLVLIAMAIVGAGGIFLREPRQPEITEDCGSCTARHQNLALLRGLAPKSD